MSVYYSKEGFPFPAENISAMLKTSACVQWVEQRPKMRILFGLRESRDSHGRESRSGACSILCLLLAGCSPACIQNSDTEGLIYDDDYID